MCMAINMFTHDMAVCDAIASGYASVAVGEVGVSPLSIHRLWAISRLSPLAARLQELGSGSVKLPVPCKAQWPPHEDSRV